MKYSRKSDCVSIASMSDDLTFYDAKTNRDYIIQSREMIYNQYNHDVNKGDCQCCGAVKQAAYNVEYQARDDKDEKDFFRCCPWCVKKYLPSDN